MLVRRETPIIIINMKLSHERRHAKLITFITVRSWGILLPPDFLTYSFRHLELYWKILARAARALAKEKRGFDKLFTFPTFVPGSLITFYWSLLK